MNFRFGFTEKETCKPSQKDAKFALNLKSLFLIGLIKNSKDFKAIISIDESYLD